MLSNNTNEKYKDIAHLIHHKGWGRVKDMLVGVHKEAMTELTTVSPSDTSRISYLQATVRVIDILLAKVDNMAEKGANIIKSEEE
jgi:hypothetical protein